MSPLLTIEQLLDAARDCAPADRKLLLDRACRDSPKLRHEIEEQLRLEAQLDLEVRPKAGQGPDPLTLTASTRPDPCASAWRPGGRFAPGQVIADRFTVVRYIACGGMGEVYEVQDAFLQGVHVALKMILPEIAGDAESSRRFEQEVLLARKLTHPNLCPIYDIAHCQQPAPPFLFFTMKLLHGETLSARLKSSRLFSPEEKVAIFRQMISGVAAIHAAGIIHRDIKPHNIMLDDSGPELCLSLMDFGLARLHEQDVTVFTRGVAGTPGYLAPELFHGQGPSQASDLFALGVVLHQVLVGVKPPQSPLGIAGPSAALDLAPVPPIFIHAVKEFLSNEPNRRCAAFEKVIAASHSTHSTTATSFVIPPLQPRRTRITRRQFAVGSAIAACAAAGEVAIKWGSISNYFHPLPSKRFVALLGWPLAADPHLEATVGAVVDAIGNELARAEAFDHNLFIIPHHVGKDVSSLAQINDVRESLGANLVLSASAVAGVKGLKLLLRVLDPAAYRVLREKTITVPMDAQFTLPEKAVRAAADLLNITRHEWQIGRSKIGTSNTDAYAAFQTAEGLKNQENDAGLLASIEAYKQAVDMDPHYAMAYAKLATAYFRSYILHRDPAALVLARSNCQAALLQDPDLVEAHLALASVLDWTGDKPSATREISKALSIDPHHPGAMLLQGQEFTRCNRWRDAEEAFTRLQTARPNYWLAHEELGVAYNSQGKYAKAAEQFRAASLAAPKRSLPLANLSTVSLQMGKPDEALSLAKKCLAIKQDDVGASVMAAAFRCEGKYVEALPYALQSVTVAPDWPGNWSDLGDTYSFLKGHETNMRNAFAQMAKLEEQTLETNPTEGPTWMGLALAQAKIGQKEASLKSLDMAEKNFAGDMDSQLSKLRTLELLGMRDQALAIASACLSRGATAFQFRLTPDLQGLESDPRFKGLLLSS